MRILFAALMLSAFHATVNAQVACDNWNTTEFFRTATADTVTACLDQGSNLNDRQGLGEWTPLHLAAQVSPDPAVIDTLLTAGADVSIRSAMGLTPLHSAAMNENPVLIKRLVQAGADLEVQDGLGRTPLHVAAKEASNPAVIEALLESGADIEAYTPQGMRPLHYAAAFTENPAIIDALLNAGANLNSQAMNGITPWQLAQQNFAIQGTDAYFRLQSR